MLGLAAAAALAVIGGAFVIGALGPSGSPGPSASPGTPSASSSAPASSDTMSDIRCEPIEQLAYHIHAHLTVRIDDESVPVPANVGIRETCLFWIHTHRDSGIIHVEAPTEEIYTLGQFFDIWGQPLTGEQILNHAVQSGEQVYAFVNGERFEGNPRSIRLTDLENIELQVGPAPLDPLPFQFPDDFR